MYNSIKNPSNGKKVSINSKLGKKILMNYLNQLGGTEFPHYSLDNPNLNLKYDTKLDYTRDLYFTKSENEEYYKKLSSYKDKLKKLDSEIKAKTYFYEWLVDGEVKMVKGESSELKKLEANKRFYKSQLQLLPRSRFEKYEKRLETIEKKIEDLIRIEKRRLYYAIEDKIEKYKIEHHKRVLEKGMRVNVWWNNDNTAYKGAIMDIKSDGTVTIFYDDGDIVEYEMDDIKERIWIGKLKNVPNMDLRESFKLNTKIKWSTIILKELDIMATKPIEYVDLKESNYDYQQTQERNHQIQSGAYCTDELKSKKRLCNMIGDTTSGSCVNAFNLCGF